MSNSPVRETTRTYRAWLTKFIKYISRATATTVSVMALLVVVGWLGGFPKFGGWWFIYVVVPSTITMIVLLSIVYFLDDKINSKPLYKVKLVEEECD